MMTVTLSGFRGRRTGCAQMARRHPAECPYRRDGHVHVPTAQWCTCLAHCGGCAFEYRAAGGGYAKEIAPHSAETERARRLGRLTEAGLKSVSHWGPGHWDTCSGSYGTEARYILQTDKCNRIKNGSSELNLRKFKQKLSKFRRNAVSDGPKNSEKL